MPGSPSFRQAAISPMASSLSKDVELADRYSSVSIAAPSSWLPQRVPKRPLLSTA